MAGRATRPLRTAVLGLVLRDMVTVSLALATTFPKLSVRVTVIAGEMVPPLRDVGGCVMKVSLVTAPPCTVNGLLTTAARFGDVMRRAYVPATWTFRSAKVAIPPTACTVFVPLRVAV